MYTLSPAANYSLVSKKNNFKSLNNDVDNNNNNNNNNNPKQNQLVQNENDGN